jgi:bifunctional non-homologous end joining protein LigD
MPEPSQHTSAAPLGLRRALPADAWPRRPDGPQWAHEIKHDGYRMICRRAGERARIFSRNALDWTRQVPAIVEAMRALPVASVVIDGEAVVCDPQGVTDFDALRSALSRRQGRSAVFLFAFDLIELDGRDLRQEPWTARREALVRLLRWTGDGIRLSEHLDGDGAAMFRQACAMGLEGIVSKRRAPYRSDWIKVRIRHRQCDRSKISSGADAPRRLPDPCRERQEAGKE